MLTEQDKTNLKGLLSMLDKQDLKSLAKTVTNTLLVPDDIKEAVTVILQYSTSVTSVLSRKKITKELIFKYLHQKKIPGINPMMTKATMVQTMVSFWEKASQKQQLNKDKESSKEGTAKRPAPSPTKQLNRDKDSNGESAATRLTSSSPTKQLNKDKDAKTRESTPKKLAPTPDSPVRRVAIIQNDNSKPATVSKATQSDMQMAVIETKDPDQDWNGDHNEGQISTASDFNLNLFSEKFTIWFYNLLNSGQTQAGQQFGPEHFWPDNILQIRVTGPNLNVHEERFTGQESATLLAQMRSHFDLYLNPNITREGVLAQSESHGVIKITVCGTAHKRDLCVGFFEQSFMVIKDPSMQNNWRIKKTEMQMKTTIDGMSGKAETSAMALVPLLQ